MRAFAISVGALMLASGAFALTQCSSNDSSNANGGDGGTSGNSDSGNPVQGCSDEDTPCSPDVPNAGEPCLDLYGCYGKNFTCGYSCTNGGQNVIAACTNGTWVITPNGSSSDCAADAGSDASATDAGDGGDAG
jgi:hypothetical protein